MSVCTVTSSPPAAARTPTPCTPSTRRSRPPRGPPTCPPSPHPSTRAGTGPRAKVSHYFITSRENSHGNQGALFRKIQPIDPVDRDSFILRIGRLQISISTYLVFLSYFHAKAFCIFQNIFHVLERDMSKARKRSSSRGSSRSRSDQKETKQIHLQDCEHLIR